MNQFLFYLLYPVGVLFCLMNFYLSCLRVPVLKGRGVPVEEIGHVSGAPILGTVFVVLGTAAWSDVPGIVPIGIVLILLDTGGPHWFAASLLFAALHRRRAAR